MEILAHGTPVCSVPPHTFGQDALLLARFSQPRAHDAACDLGTGCGAVALCWHDEGHRGVCAAVDLAPAAVALVQCACSAGGIGHIVPLCADLRTLRLAPGKRAAAQDAAAANAMAQKDAAEAAAADDIVQKSAAEDAVAEDTAPESAAAQNAALKDASAKNSAAEKPAMPGMQTQVPARAAAVSDGLPQGVAALTALPFGPFDVLACNPPFFADGARCRDSARTAARHETSCTLPDVCAAAQRLLKDGGRFCLCQRPQRLPEVFAALAAAGFAPARLQFVAAHAQSEPWLCLVEARKNRASRLRVLPLCVAAPGAETQAAAAQSGEQPGAETQAAAAQRGEQPGTETQAAAAQSAEQRRR